MKTINASEETFQEFKKLKVKRQAFLGVELSDDEFLSLLLQKEKVEA